MTETERPPSPVTTSAPETRALMETLDQVGPAALTACPGWTARHVAAHIAGSHNEARRHVDAFAAGEQLTRTRWFDERDPPVDTDLPFPVLLQRIEQEEAALLAAIAQLDGRTEEQLQWAGRTVGVGALLTHMRSESAVHRWDLVGDDERSEQLLGQQELLKHAVGFIGKPLMVKGLSDARPGEPFAARVRSADTEDLLVRVDGAGQGSLAVVPVDGEAAIETDPAARLLMLWGRRPQPFWRLQATGADAVVLDLQRLLAGY